MWWAALSSQIALEDGDPLQVCASGVVSLRLSSSAATLGTRTRFHLVLVEETTHAGRLAVLDLQGGGRDPVAPSSEYLQVDLDSATISSQPGFRTPLLSEILLLRGYNSFSPLYASGTFPPLCLNLFSAHRLPDSWGSHRATRGPLAVGLGCSACSAQRLPQRRILKWPLLAKCPSSAHILAF